MGMPNHASRTGLSTAAHGPSAAARTHEPARVAASRHRAAADQGCGLGFVDGWGQSMMGEPHKGRPNRINRDIKEMVLGALNRLGGTKYRDARL